MKNYEVLEGIKKNQRDVIDAAYNKGYDQGFIDGRYSAELIDELKLEGMTKEELIQMVEELTDLTDKT